MIGSVRCVSAHSGETIAAARLDLRAADRYRDERGRPGPEVGEAAEGADFIDGIYYLHADQVQGLEQLSASVGLSPGQVVDLLLDQEGTLR